MADQVFREKDEVEAGEGVPGIPPGTPGKVIGITGLSWIRYRVRFTNGLERNLVDASHLRRRPGKRGKG